jgi:hypothetical protein
MLRRNKKLEANLQKAFAAHPPPQCTLACFAPEKESLTRP